MKTFTMKSGMLSALTLLSGVVGIQAQITFEQGNNLLHSTTGTAGTNSGNNSGNTVIVCDIDNNGFDDIAKLDGNQTLDIEYQQPDGSFIFANNVFTISSGVNIWGGSMADVDHNGYKDFLYAGWGTGGARLIKLNSTGTGNLGINTLPGGSGIASQNCNFMDVNNDGWADIFVCNDVNESMMWVNDGAGNFPAEQGNGPYINFNVTPGTGPGPSPGHQWDESGNYGSVWTDFDNDGDVDLYIIHCRQGQASGDLRRTNVLFENNGSNIYSSNAAAHGLASNAQDWTGSFGDIDNDGDFDLLLTGHEAGNTNRILLNDGSGNFTSNTAQPTISFSGSNAYESHMEDFDNDGFIDIWMSGSSNYHTLYRNNGDRTFTLVPNSSNGLATTDQILSAACGDLNHDGRVDMYASFGSGYNNPTSVTDTLYLNTTSNANHFLTLDLRGTTSNPGALGARAFIYGPWGVQTREVRASESYGNMNTFMLHFGLGTSTSVDSVIVNWPSGSVTKLTCDVPADQFLTLIEGAPVCTLSCAGVNVTVNGTTTLCPGDSVQLTAPAGGGYTYLWSNGATSQSTYVNSAGSYSVEVTAGAGCTANSPSVDIVMNPDETPGITADGPTTFCPGGSVNLTSSASSNNTWSTSATTQTINVTAAGDYYVTYAGICQGYNSDTITVTLLNNAAPSTTDDIIPTPGTGTLTATGVGSDITWWDAPTGGTQVGTGGTYNTPFVSVNTTYYAEETHSYGGGSGAVGSTNIAASTFASNTLNGYNKFDVFANCTLVSVECSTDVAGDRIIELRDNVGAVIASYPVTLAVGTTTVPVNFTLTPGTNYQLGTNTAQNNTSFGYNSPRLVRDNGSPAFPYSLSGVIDITTGNNGTGDVNAYYYFYNWQIDIDPTDICISARTPATVYITAGINDENPFNVNVYPNPATDFVTVEFNAPEAGNAMLAVYDVLGKKVYDLNIGEVNGSVIKTINTQTYAAGIYTVKLTVNEKTYNTKVVVK